MKSFSNLYRTDIINQTKDANLDLLVIGGGITGAGILLDAKSRGLKVALLEMQDFAAGTSSRSTKLIHGGLRYLKKFEFKLVAEVGKERAIVYENAPHITSPEKMLLPLVKGGSIGKIGASLGMRLYDYLAGVKKDEQRKVLTKNETLLQEPLLKDENLLGGVSYYEYRTDDARLTLEVIKEAHSRGAFALNYFKVTSFLKDDKKIIGVKAIDQLTGQEHEILAKTIVNATGPWVDNLMELDETAKDKKLFITKGVHIVVDWEKLPLKNCLYFDAPDKRMVFAIPREGKVYIGTTDTPYEGNLEKPEVSQEDIIYLISAIQSMFPKSNIQPGDVESGWAGLRPLIRQDGKSPSDISRKDEIFISKTGLITIAGGKLTGYRKMAERVTDLVVEEIQKESKIFFAACSTDKIKLSGGKFAVVNQFKEFTNRKSKQLGELGMEQEEAKAIIKRYGSNIDKIIKIISQSKSEAKAYQMPPSLFAEVLYCIHEEAIASPSDFFVRRTGALYFDIKAVQKWMGPVSKLIADQFNLKEGMVKKFSKELESEINSVKGKVK